MLAVSPNSRVRKTVNSANVLKLPPWKGAAKSNHVGGETRFFWCVVCGEDEENGEISESGALSLFHLIFSPFR